MVTVMIIQVFPAIMYLGSNFITYWHFDIIECIFIYEMSSSMWRLS